MNIDRLLDKYFNIILNDDGLSRQKIVGITYVIDKIENKLYDVYVDIFFEQANVLVNINGKNYKAKVDAYPKDQMKLTIDLDSELIYVHEMSDVTIQDMNDLFFIDGDKYIIDEYNATDDVDFVFKPKLHVNPSNFAFDKYEFKD